MRKIYAITLIALMGCNLAAVAVTQAADYNCVPLEIAILENRVHVQCAEPAAKTRGSYPKDKSDTIVYFAIPLASEQAWVDRFIQMADIAINTGRPLRFSYTSADYSGEAYGCNRTNCRKPWAISLLKTTIVP